MQTKTKLRKMTKPLKTIMVTERSYNMDLLNEDIGSAFKLSIGSKKVITYDKHWDKNPNTLQTRRDPNRKNLKRQKHIDNMKTNKKPTLKQDNIKIEKNKVNIKFKVNNK